jgi:hypothetical protein
VAELAVMVMVMLVLVLVCLEGPRSPGKTKMPMRLCVSVTMDVMSVSMQ